MRAFLILSGLLGGIAVVGAGCTVYPKAPPGRTYDNVLGAVEEVVKAKYPFSATYQKSVSVFAMGAVEWFGTDRARKQIHVHVRKLYTGHFDAEVSVVLLKQVDEPRLGTSDPASRYVTISRPVMTRPESLAIQRLTGEEQALYEAVLQRLNG